MPRAPRVAWAGPRPPLFGGRALRSISQASLAIIVPLSLAWLGLSALQIGVLFSAGAIASALLAAAVGLLSDHLGREPLLILIALLSVGGGLGFAFSGSYTVLAIAGALGTIGRGGGAGSGGAMGPFALSHIIGTSACRDRIWLSAQKSATLPLMASEVADFNTIVETHSSRVFNLAFRITGNRQDAEDVVQDTFLQVFRGLAGFRGESELSTWIYRIALNASLTVKRKIGDEASLDALEDRIQAMADEVPDEVGSWFGDPSKAPLVQALLSEINRGCLHFMTFRLTDDQRVVYIMHAILGFSHAEIAGVLEMSENVVKARLHRAKAKLEKYFSARCQWLNPDKPGCTCRSRVGFAIALDPEILRRVRMNALASQENAQFAGFMSKQVESVSELYERLPPLRYKADTVKQYLMELERKNRS